MRFELKELVDYFLVLDRVEDVRRQRHHALQWLVQKVRLQPQLELPNVFPSDALVVEIEEFDADSHRINVFEAHWEEHLTVAVQFLQHV